VEALADSLTRGAEGSLLAVTDAYGGPLWDYGRTLLDDPDAAAGAVRDALLIAGERAGALRQPGRFAAWLYALARNECLRRGQHRAEATDAEITELATRHGLGAADIAEIVGLAPDEAADRLRGVDVAKPATRRAVPPALRAQVVDAAGPEVAEYRAALARRAGPYQHDGFPRPLDQHRIGGHMVAWLTAAAVAIALLVLVLGPGGGSAAPAPVSAEVADAAGLGAAGAPARSAPTTVPPSAPPAEPARTLHPGGADATAAVPRTTLDPTSTAPVPPAAGAPAGDTGAGTGPDGGGDQSGSGRLVFWSQNLTTPSCPATWTARVHVMPLGGAADTVTVSWSGGAVTLSRIGSDWAGDVEGLPIGADVPVLARASTPSGLVSRTAHLRYSC
jgi:DNA-directed RNA polymerase specialized sigma24 family protein